MKWPDPETEAGKIYILICLLVLLLSVGLLLHMTHNDPAEAGRTELRDACNLVFGLLTGYLAPKSK